MNFKSIIPFGKKSTDVFEHIKDKSFKDFLVNPFSQQLPSIDLTEKKDSIEVKAEIPGLNQNDIKLTYTDGILKISGEKREEEKEERDNSYYKECRYGSFSRSIKLPFYVKWENAKANFKNGVLKVVLPKSEKQEKTLKINIE